jgi:ectoine hydroxylase-related dioxygenase (phytanoyl-CoA dioxygenase family)
VPGLSLCLPQHPEENDIVMCTEPGDLLIHNCNMVHRAGNNKSKDRRRRAIGIVIIPNECQIDPELNEQHNRRLRDDIELQKNSEELKQKFAYLYN